MTCRARQCPGCDAPVKPSWTKCPGCLAPLHPASPPSVVQEGGSGGPGGEEEAAVLVAKQRHDLGFLAKSAHPPLC